MDAFVAAGELRREFFVARYPVTTTVELMRLYDRALLVEMSAIAEIPLGRFRRL
jgi:2-iminobutanoate/2-iminopropanoate deaminase